MNTVPNEQRTYIRRGRNGKFSPAPWYDVAFSFIIGLLTVLLLIAIGVYIGVSL